MSQAMGPALRINVVGTTGSGKTALARRISERLSIPHVELDAIFWGPGWTKTPDEVFRERVSSALSGDTWVADGNYNTVRDIVWPMAETVVWLDYPLRTTMWQLLWRTVRRSFTKEELWNGNRESFRTAFLSRESLFLWLLQTYWRRKKEYPVLFERPEYAHLAMVRLRSPRGAGQWLNRLMAPTRTEE